VTATNAGGSANATSTATGVVAAAAPPSGSNLYVAQSSAGAANGSSCANAESAAWFNTASDWGSGAGQIGPGVTVDLCGTITTPLVAHGSGTAADPITIYWQPGASLSEPVCPGSGDGAPGCFDTNGNTYLTLNGGTNGSVLSTANGTNLANHDANADGIYAPNCTGCTIENLNISDMYVEGSGSNDCTASNAIGLWYTGSNTTVENNTFSNEQVGSNLAYMNNTDTNMVIADNTFSDDGTGMNWISDENGGNAGPILFYGNTLSGFSLWDTSGACYHEDGIHGWTNGSNKMNYSGGVYVYDNRWSGMDGVDTGYIYFEDNPNGPNFSTPNSPIYVFNNVSTGNDSNGHIVVATGTPFIVNNTIIGTSSSSDNCMGWGVDGFTQDEVEENNAMTTCSALDGVTNSAFFATGQPNYDLYANSSGSSSFLCMSNRYTLSQFSTWNTCMQSDGGGGSGAGTHSAVESSLDLNSDGSPQTNSPTNGAGTNLTSLCTGNLTPLCTEINGTPRPATGPWDAGAY